MKQLLIAGEIFWDQFPNGSLRQGGSALNVAWHLRGLDMHPCFISRIGQDDLGLKLVQAMKKWDLSTEFLQLDSQHSTGVVKVLLDENKKATFISPPIAALDYIEYPSSFNTFTRDCTLYHGTFILRNEVSRKTIQRIRNSGLKVFMDLNLRDPYWSPELLNEYVKNLEVLKLSDDEFANLSGKQNLSSHEQLDWLQDLMKQRNIRNVLYTLGDKGSFWIQENETLFESAKKVQVVDSIGAGDAFVAAVLFMMTLEFSKSEILKAASGLAAEICTVSGATSNEKQIYKNFREKIWQ